MKIHSDKLESAPPHQLRARDVRLILEAVPPEWTANLKVIRLSNSLEHYSAYAYFRSCDACLLIHSRLGTKKQAVVAVLSALAITTLGIQRGWGLCSEAEKRQIYRLIQPFLEKIMPAVASLKSHCSPHFGSAKVQEFFPGPSDYPHPPPLPWTPQVIPPETIE